MLYLIQLLLMNTLMCIHYCILTVVCDANNYCVLYATTVYYITQM